MPITAMIEKSLMSGAAKAEGLKPKAARDALAAMRPADLAGLAAHAGDNPGMVDDLAAWRAAFPALLGPFDDPTAWFLIRIAFGMSGGVAL